MFVQSKHVSCHNFPFSNLLESTISISRHKYLKTVDLTRNYISSAGDWSTCPYIISLRLASNLISNLQDFECGPLIEVLDFSDNQLTESGDFSRFSRLEDLNISSNQLTTIADVKWEKLSRLQTLNLQGNQLTDLDALAGSLPCLLRLDCKRNLLQNLPQLVSIVKDLEILAEFDITENPVQETALLRWQIVRAIPHLKILHGSAVTAEDWVQARSALGELVPAMKMVWVENVTGVPFKDHRLLSHTN